MLYIESLGAYDETSLNYIILNIILNVSIFYAFLVLAQFYHMFHELLKPYQPLSKFLCIKFVIFFAFWQVLILLVIN